MLAILNFLNAHNLAIFQPILMILVSKFIVHRALSNKTYLSLGLLSPLIRHCIKNSENERSMSVNGSFVPGVPKHMKQFEILITFESTKQVAYCFIH